MSKLRGKLDSNKKNRTRIRPRNLFLKEKLLQLTQIISMVARAVLRAKPRPAILLPCPNFLHVLMRKLNRLAKMMQEQALVPSLRSSSREVTRTPGGIESISIMLGQVDKPLRIVDSRDGKENMPSSIIKRRFMRENQILNKNGHPPILKTVMMKQPQKQQILKDFSR